MSKLSALKKLAICLGCCKSTKDNPAMSNEEAIEFICSHIGKSFEGGVTDIIITVGNNGKIKSGEWIDTAGKKHGIVINGG